MPNSNNKKVNILNIVSGYKEGTQRMLDRSKTGTDKSELKNKVALDSLVPGCADIGVEKFGSSVN